MTRSASQNLQPELRFAAVIALAIAAGPAVADAGPQPDPQEPSPNVGLFRLPANRGEADALAGPEGFGFLSRDNNFGMMIHWILQSDARGELADTPANSSDDTFAVHCAGFALAARFYQHIRTELLVNFAGSATTLSEAWVDVELASWLHFKAGEFHYPVSLERSTTGIFFPLADADFVSTLLPGADTGAQIWGRVQDGLFEYNLALVNGAVPGNATSPVDPDSNKDVVGRVFFQPFLFAGFQWVRFLGVGIGGSDGIHRGSPATPELPRLSSWGGTLFFAYGNGNGKPPVANGRSARIVPQASWHAGPISAYGELLFGYDDVSGSRAECAAIAAVATVVLTGEPAIPLHYVIPARPFAPALDHWGAIELALTGGGVKLRPGAATAAVASAAGSTLTRTFGAGVNWYPNTGVRVMLDGERTFFAASSAIPNETLLIVRLQVVL